MDLDVGQLRAFLAVNDTGGFQSAAEQLVLTQQAVSKRLARLEATLGTLLERRPGGVVLTELGRRLLPEAREVLHRADALVETARGAPPRPLRVDVWGDRHAPHPLVRRWATAHPDVVVELGMRRNLPQALRALERGDLDLALGNVATLPEAPDGLRAAPVTGERLDALVHRDAGYEPGSTVDVDALASSTLGWPMDGGSPEVNSAVSAYAAATGLTVTNLGTNLGLDAVSEWIAAAPCRFTLKGRDWLTPVGPFVTVSLRPSPVYLWYAVWPSGGAHPSIITIVRGLRSLGDHSWRSADDVVVPSLHLDAQAVSGLPAVDLGWALESDLVTPRRPRS